MPPGDTEALSEALLKLALDHDLRLRMGNIARQRYAELFSPDVVLPLLLNTYERVAAKDNGHVSSSDDTSLAHPWARELVCG